MNLHLRFDWDYLVRHLPDFGPAILTALTVFGWSLVFAFLIGILLALLRLSRGPLRWIGTSYVEVYRNTPLLVQLYFIFFGLPLVGVVLDPLVCAVVGLAGQHAAYFGETIRGTIRAVHEAQHEAALALGMPPAKAFRLVVLPQALRDAIPAFGNQVVLLVQDTSLVSTIGVIEIVRRGYILAEQSAASFEMFLAVGAIYLVLSTVLSAGTSVLERAYRVVR